MAKPGRIGRLSLAAMAVSLLVVMVGPAVGAPAVKGDPAAWAELVAALQKQHSISFRGKSAEGGHTTIIEFTPPGSQHVILHGYPDMITPERITVGDTVWSLDPRSHKWNCSDPLKLSPADLVPQWERKGEVTVTRIPGPVIGGTPTRGYAWTGALEFEGRALTMNVKTYVGVQNGLPLREETTTPKATSTLDYYDYGANISIKPPCP